MTAIDRASYRKFNAGTDSTDGILFIKIPNGNMVNLLPL